MRKSNKKILVLSLLLLLAGIPTLAAFASPSREDIIERIKNVVPGLTEENLTKREVLAGSTQTQGPDGEISFNMPSLFNDKVMIDGEATISGNVRILNKNLTLGTGSLTASNVIYGLIAGDNISISGGQTPTISASFSAVTTTLQGQSGDLTLVGGEGITIAGLTISNDDPGSAQNIFKTINAGGTNITAGSNNDTLNIQGGSGISISASDKTITINNTQSIPAPFSNLETNGIIYATGSDSVTSLSPGASGYILQSNGSGSAPSWVPNSSGGNTAFSAITSGTNTQATMVVGSGASLDYLGSGSINASTLGGATFGAPGSIGSTTPNTAAFTTLSASGTVTLSSLSTGILHVDGSGNVSSAPVNLGGGATEISGALGVTNGGTGLNSIPTNGQLLIGNGTGYSLAQISGTSNRISVTNGSGSIILSTPQDIDTAAAPTFASLNLTNESNLITIGTGNQGIISMTNLTAPRTYNFPDQSGDICLSSGNCSGSGGSITGSGTTNFVAKFTSASGIGDSALFDNGKIGIGTTNPIGLFNVNGAPAGQALAVFNYTGSGQNIITASASGTTRFTLDTGGNLNIIGGTYNINGTQVLSSTTLGAGVTTSSLTTVGALANGSITSSFGNIDVGVDSISGGDITSVGTGGFISTGNNAGLDFSGTGNHDIAASGGVLRIGPYTLTGDITGNGNDITGLNDLSAAGTITFGGLNTDGGLLYTNGTGTVAQTTAGNSGQILQSNGTGAPTWVDASSVGTNYWQRANGAVAPSNVTDSVLVGGTATASAKFSISGTTGNASTSGNLTFNTPGSIQTTANQSLILGGISTGNIFLTPANGNGTTTNNGTFNLSSGKTYQINGTDVLSSTTLGSSVVNSSLTGVGALTSGSITTGFGTIATTNTITGTTLNGTTGINTGASAGTQRIDASGNLVNIGTIGSTYLTTATNIVNLAASTALQFNGTTVIDASRNISNIAGVATNLNPTAANTYSLGTSIANQYANIYGQAIFQNGNSVCDSSGNCAGSAGGSKWQLNSGSLAPYTASNKVVLGGNTTTAFQLEVNGNQTGKALVSFNQTGDQNILTASSAGVTKFNLTNNGNLQFAGSTNFLNTLTSLATASRTYTLPDSTGTICLVEAGNCAGSGGGITGSGTAGQVSFFNGSGTITSETSGFAWDATNKRLGIGTNTPLGKFTVEGANTGKALTILNETGDQNIIAASASGSTVLVLDRSGNLALTGQLSNLTGNTLTANDNVNLTTGNVYQINGTNVLDSTTLGSSVVSSSLTTVSALSSGAIINGFGTILTSNTIQGTDITASGTTGFISSGAGAGLNFSGSGIHNITASNGTLQLGATTLGGAISGNGQNITDVGNLSATGSTTFSPTGTNDISFATDSDSTINITGLQSGSGSALCIDGSNNVITCTTGGSDITGSGTAGQISFFTSAGNISSETTGFAWDATNKKLGIGTDSPTGKVTVNGASTGKALTIFNETGDQNIIAASASGTTRLTLDRSGNLNIIGGAYQIGGTNVLSSTTLGSTVVNSSLTGVGALTSGSIASGFGTIFTANTIQGSDITASGTTGFTSTGTNGSLTFSGSGNHDLSASSGTLRLGAVTLNGAVTGNGQDITGINNLSAAGTVTFSSLTTNGGLLYTNGSGTVAQTTAGNSGQILQSNGTGAPTWVDASTVGTNYWQKNAGALAPINISDDLLVGGTSTASAKFQVVGTTGNASTSGNLTFNTTGSIQTTRNQSLTVGGNSTGDITISPRNGNGTTTNTGTFNLASGKTYQINGTDVLSATTLGSGVTTSSLTTVGALANGSIANGFGTITTSNTIQGSDITASGTTGYTASGASAGLTFSGSGNHLISASTGTLQIGAATLTGAITGNGQNITGVNNLANTGTVTFGSLTTNGGLLYTNGSGVVAQTTAGSSGQCLVSNGGGAPTWGNCDGASSTYWNQANGALYTGNTTVDLLVGGTSTTSAKFAVLNVNTNNPTSASVSGTTGGAYITSAGTLQTTNNQALTIGGNSTGDITISPRNGSGTTTNTGTFNLSSGKTYQINGTDVLSSTTLGTSVVNSSLTSVGALTSGSIASGFGTIATTNTITGTTLNGTTGINTGATGGTQRIDASGNLLNIGTVSSTYFSTSTNVLNLAASTVLQFNGTTVIDASRNLNNIAGVSTNLNPTAANTYSLGTGTGNQYQNIYGQTLYQNGNQVCDTTGNCAGTGGGSQWQRNGTVLAPYTATDQVVLGGNTTTAFQLEVSGSRAGKALVSFNETGNQNILTASASGTTVFNINNNGNLQFAANSGFLQTLTSVATAGRTYTLPDTTGTICLVEAGNCAGSGGGITGSGTAGQIAFFNGTGTITSETSGFSWDATNNKLGIGTNTPTGNLTVDGASTGKALTVFNETGDQAILTGSASGTTRFTFDRTGNLNIIGGGYQIGGTSVLSSTTLGSTVVNSSLTGVGALTSGSIASGFGTISTTNAIQGTDITATGTTGFTGSGAGAGLTFSGSGNHLISASNGTLQLGAATLTGAILGNGQNITGVANLANTGTVTFGSLTTNGGLLYTNGSGVVAQTTAGSSGQILQSNGTGAPTWVDASIVGTNYWQKNAGTLSPLSITDDLLIGGTSTASAKFQVVGTTGNASTAGNLTFNSAGTIQTTNNQAFTIGGNSTGDITISPRNGNGTTTNTGNFNLATGKTYQINGTDVLSSTTLGTTVVNSSLTGVGALTSGSIASGFGTISTANTIQGTNFTATGTTGFTGSGAGAGLTFSGSGNHLISASTGTLQLGAATLTGALAGGGQNITGVANLANTGTVIFGSLTTNGGLLYTNGSGTVAQTTAGNSGQILVSNGGGAPTWVDAGVVGTNYWQKNAGTLSPLSITDDLLIGGTSTASAKFQIVGTTGNASTSGTLTFNTAGNIQTTNNQSLTIGGNSTGDITISPRNGNGTTTNTGTFNLSLGKTYQINGTDVLSSTTLGSTVVNSSLTGVGALTSGSIASGFGTISTANTIQGTNITATGTTGFTGSGAGAGLTFSGSGNHLISASTGTLQLGAATLTGALAGGGQNITGVANLANTGSVTFGTFTTNGGLLYTNGSGAVAQTTAGSAGQILQSNGGGAPTWVDSASLGTNYWQRNAGTLAPVNIGDDLLVGGIATSSAKFQVFANSGNASMSGNLTLNSAGNIQTTNNQTLTLGGSSTGDITISPRNGNGTTTNTGNFNLATGKTYQINGTNVLSSTTLGSTVVNSSLTGVGALTSGSIASGFGTISTANTIQGTDITSTGTTGYTASGNGAGLAFSGTGNHDISASNGTLRLGAVTLNGAVLGNNQSITGLNNLSAAGTLTLSGLTTNGGVLYTNGTGGTVAQTTAGSAGQCLQSNGSGAPTWGSCDGASSSYWNQANGALYAGNTTVDLLIGGTSSSSAKFAVLNVNNGGITTASVSAGVNGGAYIAANGTLQTTNNQTLTLGGNSTGDITISPRNGSGTTTNTGTFNVSSGKTYQINGTDVLSATALGTGVTTSSLTTVGALANGSITSGFGTITTANTIQGTNITATGTTGYTASGNGAGLTFSGSGNHLISASTGTLQLGAATLTGALAGGGQNITGVANLANTGTVTFGTFTTDGGLLYTNGSGAVAQTTAGSSGQILQSNGSGAPTWVDSATVGTNYWQRNAGTLAPINITDDLLIGGISTASAKFQVFANSGNASMSGNLTLNSAGNIQTTNNQTLTIGGNSTGDITISPRNGNGTTTNTGNFNLATGKTYQINGTDVLSSTTLGTSVVNSSLTGVGALISGSIASGFGTILTTNTIQGSDITASGTTGFTGSGAGAGLTFSGTGNHLISASTGTLQLGAATLTGALAGGGQNITGVANLANTGTVTFGSFTTAGGLLYTNGSGAVSQTTAGSSNQCLISTAGGAPTWSDCVLGSASQNFWQLNNGALSPFSNTADLLVGGTATNSAKFGLINVNNGTPTATISAGTAGGTFLTADGNLSTTARQTLTLGNSSAYNTTGNIVLQPNGTGNVGIGLTNPVNKFSVSDNTAGRFAANIVQNSATGYGAYVFVGHQSSTVDALSIQGFTGSVATDLLQVKGNGNIGIGTSTPTTKLHVNSTTAGKALAIFNDTGSNQNILTASASGTTVMNLDRNGNLAIEGQLSDLSQTTLTVNDNLNLVSGNEYQINGTSVLSSSTLGSTVTTSSLTTVGVLGAGSIASGFGAIDNGNDNIQGGNFISTTAGGFSGTGAGAGLTFSGSGNHLISASTGTLQFGAATLTGAITGNTQNITGLGQLTVDNLRLDGNTLDTTSGALTLTPTTTLTLNSTGDMTLDGSTDIILDADGADVILKDGGTTFATFSNASTDLVLDVAGDDFVSNDRFTIGTTTPGVGQLNVSGTQAGKALAIFNDTGSNQNILTASASGTTEMTLDRSGNLAIEGSLSDLGGTTLNINDNLSVTGDVSATGTTGFTASGAGAGLTLSGSGSHTISSTGQLNINSSADIIMSPTNAVGIGTSTLGGFKLAVSQSTVSDVMKIENTNSAGYASIQYSANGAAFFQGVGGSASLMPNKWYVSLNGGGQSESMVFTNGGDMGIGTYAPGSKLDVEGTITGNGWDGGGLTQCEDIQTASSSAEYKLQYDATTKQFSCASDGTSMLIKKVSDQTVTNSTTLVNDTAFFFDIGANESWLFNMDAVMTMPAANGVKFAIGAPNGNTCRFSATIYENGSANTGETCNGSTTINVTTSGTSSETTGLYGVVNNGGTAGRVYLRWAQQTSGVGTSVTMESGSFMTASKISGADLAEMYFTKDPTVKPGDIVQVDGSIKAGVKKTDKSYDSRTLGIISTKPGHVLSDNTTPEGKPVALALAGRVPVNVSTENGPIEPGDYLTTSSKPGVAMKATKPGQMIGKAMQAYSNNDKNAVGQMIVFINLTWADPTVGLNENGEFVAQSIQGQTNPPALTPEQSGASSESANLDLSSLQASMSALHDTQASQEGKLREINEKIASLSAKIDLGAPAAPSEFTASSAADLNLDTIDANKVTVSDTLDVLGKTTVGDLGVTGNITAGIIAIHGLEGEINTLSGPLKIQENGLNGVEIVDGKVTITKNGDITTKGNIKAKTVTTTKLNITEDEDATESASAVLSSSAGSVTIESGKTSIEVNTSALTEKSLIFATPDDPVSVGTKAKDKDTFIIKLAEPQTDDLKVKWWIVN